MIKIDFIQFNFVLKKITKKTGKRGKSGEIFYLKHPVRRFLGRERNIKNSSKRGKPGEIFDLKHPVEENLDLPGMERGIINKNRDNGGLSEDFSPGNHIKSG